ncbi:DNA polymerase III subunit beta [Ancylobacter moscoviensis]
MKLTVERAPFLAALQRAARAVERRNTIPILANLLLRAEAGAVSITATDLDVEVTQTVKAEIAAAGEPTTLPAHTLLEIVRKLPDGAQIGIEADNAKGTAVLRAGRSRFSLQTLPADEFPDLAEVAGGYALALPGATLADAIGRVEFAISTEETRYYLNGIFLHRDPEGGGRLRLVATDGHRLSLASLAVETPPQLPGVIVPRKAVAEIKKMAEAADKADLHIDVSANRLTASLGDWRFSTKLIDGTFPDYGRVIPADNDKLVTLQAEEMLAAVDRVGTVASERGRAVKCTFDTGRLALEVTNPDAGTAYEEVEAAYAGEPIEIGFNARYIVDLLNATAKAGEIEIALRDPGSPALIRRPDAKDALCVLMPMRV